MSGDNDYLPLIEELKRRGKLVYLAFHEDAEIDPRLVRAADSYRAIAFDSFGVEPIK